MKKGIILTLLIGISLKSFAGTGNASDEFKFLLTILGFLFIVVVLLYAIDYLQKNGKTMIYSGMSFLRKQFSILWKFLQKFKSDYFDLSYF